MSKAAEDALLWRLVLLGAAAGALPAAALAPLLPELLAVVDAGLAAPSRVAQVRMAVCASCVCVCVGGDVYGRGRVAACSGQS